MVLENLPSGEQSAASVRHLQLGCHGWQVQAIYPQEGSYVRLVGGAWHRVCAVAPAWAGARRGPVECLDSTGPFCEATSMGAAGPIRRSREPGRVMLLG